MDDAEKQAKCEALLAAKPKLHFWGDEWQDGGLSDNMLRALCDYGCRVSAERGAVVLETGAGLSTLVFLICEPERVVAIAPNADLHARVRAQVASFGIDASRLEFHLGRSEELLPGLTLGRPAYVDLALIDGGHGMTTVFVDFCYINTVLKRGGYLAIDDVQLHSVRQLYLLLKHQPEFELVAEHGKLVVFQKTGDRRYLPEWGRQPFVVMNS